MEPERKMFKAVCSMCSRDCEVPFQPKEGRPVLCRECFLKKRSSERKFKRRDFEVTCGQCGKETTVPFKPVQGKPVLCRECFKKV